MKRSQRLLRALRFVFTNSPISSLGKVARVFHSVASPAPKSIGIESATRDLLAHDIAPQLFAELAIRSISKTNFSESLPSLDIALAALALDRDALTKLGKHIFKLGFSPAHPILANDSHAVVRIFLELYAARYRLERITRLGEGLGLPERDYTNVSDLLRSLYGKPILPTFADRRALRSLATSRKLVTSDIETIEDILSRSTFFYYDDLGLSCLLALGRARLRDARDLSTLVFGALPDQMGVQLLTDLLAGNPIQFEEGEEAAHVSIDVARSSDLAISRSAAKWALEEIDRRAEFAVLGSTLAELEQELGPDCLVVVDGKIHPDLMQTFVNSHVFIVTNRSSTPLVNYRTCHILPERHWYSALGTEQYGRSLAAAQVFCRECLSGTRFERFSFALSMMSADHTAPRMFVIENALAQLEGNSYRRLIVCSERREVATALQLAVSLKGRDLPPPIIQWAPKIKKPVRSPEKWVQAVAVEAVWQRQSVLNFLGEIIDSLKGADVAVVMGSFNRWQHRQSLVNITRALLNHSKVICIVTDFLNADNHNSLIAEIGKFRPNTLHIISINSITKNFKLPSFDILKHHPTNYNNLSLTFNPLSADLPLYKLDELADYLTESELRSQASSLLAFGDLMTHLFSRLKREAKPKYCINLIGRSPRGSIVNNIAKLTGFTTCDAYIFTVANSAKQLPSEADYLSVIDSIQEAFVADVWGRNPEYIVKAGYLWDQRRSVLGWSPDTAEKKPIRRVLIATQSGFSDGNLRMLSCIAAALSMQPSCDDPKVSLLLRPHPREDHDVLANYVDVLVQGGVPSDAIALSLEPMQDALRGVDCVITQTSNIGIEAAAAGCFVIKYLVASTQISRIVADTPYSYNIFNSENETDLLRSALYDPVVRLSTLRNSHVYWKENPALVHGDGAERLVDFLEERTVQRSQNESMESQVRAGTKAMTRT